MRLSSGKFRAGIAALGVCIFLAAATGQSAAGERPHSGWYLGAGIGANWTSGMKQVGHNRDTTCYPDDDCGHLVNGAPEGYRWFYDLDMTRGAAFEISIGHRFDDVRLELSATQRTSGVEQEFTGIAYLDGSAIVPAANSDYESTSMTSVGDLRTRTLSLNAYYDFPLAESRIAPYLGAGLGLSLVELSGLYYHSRYSCRQNVQCGEPGQYDSRQAVDLSDTVLSGHLYAGADYSLDDRFLLGLKLSYSLVGDIVDRSAYSEHKIADITNLTDISGIDQWSLTIGLKYLFGD